MQPSGASPGGPAPAATTAEPPVVEPWGAAALERARRVGLLVLVVDAAWSEHVAARDRGTREQAAFPPAGLPAAYVVADQDAHPDVALRVRWMLRLFDVDEFLPYTVVCLPAPRGLHLLPLHAIGGESDAAGWTAALASVARDAAAVRADAVARRRALATSARRGWRGRPSLARRLSAGLATIKADCDPDTGGFASAPGVLRPTAYGLLLDAARRGDDLAADLARRGLASLAASPVRDALDGGFFHGARDPDWHVPCFARTAADNAALLAVYSSASRPGAPHLAPHLADVARGIGRYLLGTLRDPASGAFFASQGADEAYYAWTSSEALAALPYDRVQTAFLHFNIQPRSEVLADRRRNVLHAAHDAEALARMLGSPPDEVATALAEARAALLAARLARAAPALDRTRYVDVNAQIVSALLAGAAALDEPSWQMAAMEALAWLEETCEMGAVPAIPHGVADERAGGGPYLGDHAALGGALLDAHAQTGEPRYLARAESVAAALAAQFREPRTGALFDVPPGSLVARAFWPEQPLEDSAGPAPAAAAVRFLSGLAQRTGRLELRQVAADALRTGAAAAADDPTASAGYHLALAEYLHPRPPSTAD